MTKTQIAITELKNSEEAGRELGRTIRIGFAGAAADAVFVFASAQHDYTALLRGLCDEAGTDVVAGSSSAGEFTNVSRGEGQVSALGIRSQDMRFALGLGQDVSTDPLRAASQVAASFQQAVGPALPHRSAMVMTDALAGHTDALVEELTVLTGGEYKFFGGGAGDDGAFRKTHVFAGRVAHTNAVVALEIQSIKPLGIGVAHGWEPVGAGLRVTESREAVLVSLNGVPALDAFEQHAEKTGQKFDRADALPFFLHNVIGIRMQDGFRLRVPLAVQEDGSILCAAAIPEGSVVHFMRTSAESAVQAAKQATRAAISALGGNRPAGAFVFDCVATRLRMGAAFEDELQACSNLLEPAGFVGCNTYGQIARAEGQFSGFHNCTAVVCALPE
ncbi:MAG: FIST N-terminal domain-containing protein [Ramlibacter sp.]